MSAATKRLLDLLERERAQRPHKTEAATQFNERVCEHLAFCLQEAFISFDRAREILGVSTETMRELVNEWVRIGWLKPSEDGL